MFSKSKWLFLILALSMTACNRGPHQWDSFQEKYADKGTTIRLNGLMKLGLGLIADKNNDPETRALFHILKKMKGVEINIIPASRAHFSAREVARLSDALDRSSYESLINVRKGDQMVNLWARGDENTFSDPLVLINSGNEVVMITMTGTLTTEDIQTLSQAGMKYASGKAMD